MKTASTVTVDLHLLEEARRAFIPHAIRPELPKDQIMFDAGAVAVVDWLEARIKERQHRSHIIIPDEEVQVPDSKEASLRRLAAQQ